ncbi:MAG: siderophore-interacting protein [Acidimicrobiaceae bacterium]|jgi:NADPH-dependent ferric siderophore reductase|nr:siderophore-interacting protein [Acidimicrobiaceae bacterium]MBT5578982.1 siderophore-interacting protein [Acidimicrobiaceae bacterium]
MLRLVLGGERLAGFPSTQPAASIRLVVPWAGDKFAIPTWTGNEFLLSDGRRPALRTFTLVDFDASMNQLILDIVRHRGGEIAQWAEAVRMGDAAAVSGPGRGETIDRNAQHYILLGDETAIPAIRQMIEAIPDAIRVTVHIETVSPEARLELPVHPGLSIIWHDAEAAAPPCSQLQAAITTVAIDDATRIWAAGEAAAAQAIRKYLFNERAVPRHHTSIRGYWKMPR